MLKKLGLVASLAFALNAPAMAEQEVVVDAMLEYMEFADYGDGTIAAEQIRAAGTDGFFIIDTRLPGRFNESHMPNAINIDWRQVLNHLDEIPKDKPVIVYCDTGILSSKAHFALRLAGYTNVKVLVGGYGAWASSH